MNRNLVFCSWALLISFFLLQEACAAVKLKLSLTNPSASQEKTLLLKSSLPKGVEPQMVLEKGSLQIGYNYKDSLFYVYDNVRLKPQETVVFEVSIKDIWSIPEPEISALELHVNTITESLKGSAYYEQAVAFAEGINSRLLSIKERQAAVISGIEDRLGAYEVNAGLLKTVKRELFTLEELVIAAAGSLPDKLKLGESGEEPVISSKEMVAGLDQEKLGVVKFAIEVSNPSSQARVTQVRLSMPAEVASGHIVDAGGLDINYDYKKALCYVSKEGLPLGPEEVKKFAITVKDVWVIPQEHISAVRQQVKSLRAALENSDYSKQALALSDEAEAALDDIVLIQETPAKDVELHIGYYRVNLRKLSAVKHNLLKLEDLLTQAGGKLAGAFKVGANANINENQQGREASEGGKSSELQRGAKGLKLTAGAIFKGKAPTPSTTWKIIWAIIGFLGIVSFLSFTLWWGQSQKTRKGKS